MTNIVLLSFSACLMAICCCQSSTAIPRRVKHDGKQEHGPDSTDAHHHRGGERPSPMTENRVRDIVHEELVAYNLTAHPSNNNKSAAARARVRLWDFDGNEFDIPDNHDAAFRTTIPTSMCTASQLSASTASNQLAFKNAHNLLRGRLNSCAYKVPVPYPLLSGCVSSTYMSQQADMYTQSLKQTNGCNLQHSSQQNRTLTFQLDNGTQVNNAYIGENLAWYSVCLTTTDTNRYNQYQAQYCNNGYLYNASSYAWWSEVASWSNLNGGNWPTTQQQSTANSNGNTQVGHFTQMAWANSDVLGSAAAECSTTSPRTFTCSPAGVGGCGSNGQMTITATCYSWIITGRYYKGGNYVGQNPYTSTGAICNPPSSG